MQADHVFAAIYSIDPDDSPKDMAALRKANPSLGVTLLEDHGTVTCVGTGLNADWSIARKALATARSLGAHVAATYGSALQLTLIVKRDQVKALTKALHEALIGG